jgi:hypothetical protein
MAADDHPFDALEHRFEMEDTSASAISRMVLNLASHLPMPWLLSSAISEIKDHLAADGLDRIRLVLETCKSEVRESFRLSEGISAGKRRRRQITLTVRIPLPC